MSVAASAITLTDSNPSGELFILAYNGSIRLSLSRKIGACHPWRQARPNSGIVMGRRGTGGDGGGEGTLSHPKGTLSGWVALIATEWGPRAEAWYPRSLHGPRVLHVCNQ